MTTSTSGERTRKARVIYEFNGDEENQLSIKVGQIITLIGEVTPENWILAKSKKGVEGYIPDGYFEIMSESGKKPKGPPPVPKKKKKKGGSG